jgi:hypothetical protein
LLFWSPYGNPSGKKVTIAEIEEEDERERKTSETKYAMQDIIALSERFDFQNTIDCLLLVVFYISGHS